MADKPNPKRYTPQYPEAYEIDDSMHDFLTEFYRLSDDNREDNGWVECFTEDAEVIVGGDRGKGIKGGLLLNSQLTEDSSAANTEQAIHDLRGRMWAMVQGRKNTVLKVFPGWFPETKEEPEAMVLGSVSYLTRDGRTIDATWSAHAVLRDVDGEWRFARYHVWVQNLD